MSKASAKLTAPLLLAVAGLLGSVPAALAGTGEGETLADLLARERIDFKVQHPEDLGKLITNGDVHDSAETRIVATYVEEGDRPGDRLFVFCRARAQGGWRAAEVRWPADSENACAGRSITEIDVVHGYIYLTAHLNPSAECTLVLTEELEPRDTLYGWQVAHFQDGGIVYEHSEIHFAPTHYAELSIYDPATRRQQLLYPPKTRDP